MCPHVSLTLRKIVHILFRKNVYLFSRKKGALAMRICVSRVILCFDDALQKRHTRRAEYARTHTRRTVTNISPALKRVTSEQTHHVCIVYVIFSI